MSKPPETAPFSPTLHDLSEALAQDVFGGADPIVVAIKGGWGEGKTFFWRNSVVARHAASKPGYVSVFGKDSLGAIQRAVAVALPPAAKAETKVVTTTTDKSSGN